MPLPRTIRCSAILLFGGLVLPSAVAEDAAWAGTRAFLTLPGGLGFGATLEQVRAVEPLAPSEIDGCFVEESLQREDATLLQLVCFDAERLTARGLMATGSYISEVVTDATTTLGPASSTAAGMIWHVPAGEVRLMGTTLIEETRGTADRMVMLTLEPLPDVPVRAPAAPPPPPRSSRRAGPRPRLEVVEMPEPATMGALAAVSVLRAAGAPGAPARAGFVVGAAGGAARVRLVSVRRTPDSPMPLVCQTFRGPVELCTGDRACRTRGAASSSTIACSADFVADLTTLIYAGHNIPAFVQHLRTDSSWLAYLDLVRTDPGAAREGAEVTGIEDRDLAEHWVFLWAFLLAHELVHVDQGVSAAFDGDPGDMSQIFACFNRAEFVRDGWPVGNVALDLYHAGKPYSASAPEPEQGVAELPDEVRPLAAQAVRVWRQEQEADRAASQALLAVLMAFHRDHETGIWDREGMEDHRRMILQDLSTLGLWAWYQKLEAFRASWCPTVTGSFLATRCLRSGPEASRHAEELLSATHSPINLRILRAELDMLDGRQPADGNHSRVYDRMEAELEARPEESLWPLVVPFLGLSRSFADAEVAVSQESCAQLGENVGGEAAWVLPGLDGIEEGGEFLYPTVDRLRELRPGP